jgi:hypothetical protein
MATAEEIRAELEAGPQTQDALDAALTKYTPAQMQAAFPEYGNVENYTNAAAEAAARMSASRDSGPAASTPAAAASTTAAEDSSREKASSAGGSSSALDPNDPKALRAAIQAGPQTQDALDLAMMKYTPAQLQAAFPEYGRVSDYNQAVQEAYARQEVKDRDARRADPNYVSAATPGGAPLVSKVPQSEIDAAKAAAQQAVKDGKLTQADYDFLVWRTNEINPMSQQKIGQDYVTQGSNPYDQKSWSIAKEANAKAARQNELYAQNGLQSQTPDWQTPGYEARQKARDDAAAAAAAKAAATPSPFTAGPGPVVGPTPGLITGNMTTPTKTPTGGNTTTTGTPTGGNTTTTGTGTTAPPKGNTGTANTSTGVVTGGTSTGTSTVTQPTAADVPVYGPDGTMYPSAMAARAAGVYNFSTAKPTTPAPAATSNPVPGTTNITTPAPTTGLINSNSQLYTRPTTFQFPGK